MVSQSPYYTYQRNQVSIVLCINVKGQFLHTGEGGRRLGVSKKVHIYSLPWERPWALASPCCASPPNFTVSAERRTTTWRRNTGRAGMHGMRGAALRAPSRDPVAPGARLWDR